MMARMMARMTAPITTSCLARPAIGIFLSVLVLLCSAAAEETTVAPPAAVPSLPDLTADLQTTFINRSGHASVSKVHITRSGKAVRYEHKELDPPEITIINFGDLKEYRVYAADQIYFETGISNRLWFKAQREGLVPVEERPDLVIVTERIVLRKDALEGHPCEIVLQIRSIKDRKALGSDYTLLWEALDMNRQPLRVAYHLADFAQTIVDFKNPKTEPIDPALIQPPPGFISMNPY